MEQSPFRNPRLIRRFTILSFSRPMGNEAGILAEGKKREGEERKEKKRKERRSVHDTEGIWKRERENRAHVRSPQAQRVKDANGKNERGKRGREGKRAWEWRKRDAVRR